MPAIRRRLARTGGDYKAYRKAYQAWNKRERTRRTKPQPQSCAAATPDAAVHAAVNKADATPVKRRRMMLGLAGQTSTRKRTSRTRWPSVVRLAT